MRNEQRIPAYLSNNVICSVTVFIEEQVEPRLPSERDGRILSFLKDVRRNGASPDERQTGVTRSGK